MYLEHYGFQEKPFTITPNPRFIFLSKNHKEAFGHLLFGVKTRAGFIMLTGEIGTGKTTLLRSFLNEISGDDGYRAALILNPCLSDIELLRAINREFGLSEGGSKAESINLLNEFLLKQNSEGRTIILVIDEAQNLQPEVLEQVRLISNLETDSAKLIQIILAGQPELGDLLRRRELRQLAQRVTVSYHLLPMDYADVKAYIEHRILLAGFWAKTLFSRSALRRIYRHSGGTPRLINIICDRALLIGFTMEAREINASIVKKATSELRRHHGGQPRKLIPYALAALLAAVLAFFLLSSFSSSEAPKTKIPNAGAPADLPAFSAALDAVGEQASAIAAFKAIAPLWGIQSVNAHGGTTGHPVITLARRNSLHVYHFRGTMKGLIALDTPAILELKSPRGEVRFVALVGGNEGRILIAPATGGRSFLLADEVANTWTGNAFVPWRNRLNLTPINSSNFDRDNIRNIQALLKIAGHYKGELNGRYDRVTADALEAFQATQRIHKDRLPGPTTLFLLGKSAGDPAAPRLSKGGPNQ